MPVKKSRQEKISPPKAPGLARRVEEVDFFDYLKNKKDRRYIEEIGMPDHLNKRNRPETP